MSEVLDLRPHLVGRIMFSAGGQVVTFDPGDWSEDTPDRLIRRHMRCPNCGRLWTARMGTADAERIKAERFGSGCDWHRAWLPSNSSN